MTEKKIKVIDSSEITRVTRKSPATLILESLDGDYKTMRQVADQIGVHVETMRRLCRTDKVVAPSKAVRSGKLTIYLFTPEDVEEIERYFSEKGYVINEK